MSTQQAKDQGWFKSSYSGSDGGDCVEIAGRPDGVQVRDSKVADRARLAVAPAPWSAFLDFATHN
jgi:hypothetical protein